MPSQSHLRAVTDDDASTELDSSYPEKFLTCRSVGHQWEIIGFYHAQGEVVRALTCRRCTMDRHDYWSPRGTRLRNAYDQPDGYRIPGGVYAQEVRVEVLNRVTIYDSSDAMHDALFGAKGSKKAHA